MRPDAEEEFRDYVAARSPALLRTAYLLAGGDWALAEDLLQAALTKTYLAWGRIHDRGAVDAYVRRTLATTARRGGADAGRASVPPPCCPSGRRSTQVDEQDALWRLVRELPPRQRAVLVLRFYEDLSEADTARALGLSPGTVKSRTSRALATLRGHLTSTGAC